VLSALRSSRWSVLIPVGLTLALAGLTLLTRSWKADAAHAAQPPADAGKMADSAPPSGFRDARDSFGDGFPDAARLDRPADRANFVRWLTFLAEAAYYQPTADSQDEIQDCAALIRYAYRNALVEHTPTWRREIGLPADPGFGEIAKFSYPDWPLGRSLFRTRPGPLGRGDFERAAFAEFADAATLLEFNTFPVSRQLAAARPGDLIFFHQPEQEQPFHAMLFVGRSYFQPQGADWLVYHTGEIGGRRGEVRHLRAATLLDHPDARWRPLATNPRFLGVYRFDLLR
jgi:uncharacterized protein YfaT (DUF1175 family)